MSSSDVSSVTNHFSTAAEGFVTTSASTVNSGATTVPLNTTAGLTNGKVFVGIIEPGTSGKEQTFTGLVDTSGSQITNVVWTRGTNTSHSAGVTVVDYVTGTQHNMTTKGILVEHSQNGTHANITPVSVTTPSATVTNLTVSSSATIANPTFSGTPGTGGLSSIVLTNPYKFRVYRNTAQNTSAAASLLVACDTKTYDTSSNVDVVTNKGRFTAPISGFYSFSAAVLISASGTTTLQAQLFKNGSFISGGNVFAASATAGVASTVTDVLQLSATDYIEFFVFCNATTGITTGSGNTYFSGFLVSAT